MHEPFGKQLLRVVALYTLFLVLDRSEGHFAGLSLAILSVRYVVRMHRRPVMRTRESEGEGEGEGGMPDHHHYARRASDRDTANVRRDVQTGRHERGDAAD